MTANRKFEISALITAMLLVSIALVVPAVTAKEAANTVENADGGIGILALVETVPMSGDLSQPSDTDTYKFTVPSGAGWDRVSVDVTVSNIDILDRNGDISIELIKPNGTKVAGDTLYATETHLNFNYDPGYDLTAGTWKIRIIGVDIDGNPGYDGSASVYN